ncbi:MAG: hypothetical protein DRJ52_02700 [Thermoprotei archaeon]|nr:MAG: hypothetical protein DRJ52_02700 [Thermoprotei archaeon]
MTTTRNKSTKPNFLIKFLAHINTLVVSVTLSQYSPSILSAITQKLFPRIRKLLCKEILISS